MLLDIETRIGELAEKEERAKPKPGMGIPKGGTMPSGKPLKHERIGLPKKRMHQAQAISKHPDIIDISGN